MLSPIFRIKKYMGMLGVDPNNLINPLNRQENDDELFRCNDLMNVRRSKSILVEAFFDTFDKDATQTWEGVINFIGELTKYEDHIDIFFERVSTRMVEKEIEIVTDYLNSQCEKNEDSINFMVIENIRDLKLLQLLRKNIKTDEILLRFFITNMNENNHDFIDYFFEDGELLKLFKDSDIKSEVIFSDKSIFNKIIKVIPDLFDNFEDRTLKCSFEIALELRVLGLLHKIDLKYFTNRDSLSFISHCEYEFKLKEYLDSEFSEVEFEYFEVFKNFRGLHNGDDDLLDLYSCTSKDYVIDVDKFINKIRTLINNQGNYQKIKNICEERYSEIDKLKIREIYYDIVD